MKDPLRSSPSAIAGPSVLLRLMPWGIAVLVLLLLPHVFVANSTITIMSQMAITIVFALSYNMLLGQAGMLSFGHAIYLGFGGFMCIHVMNHLQATGISVPLPFLPIFAGLFSMGMAMVIGSFSTRRSGVVFAMISLGMVELVASFSIIGYSFFRGGGVSGDRTLGVPFFGVEFLRQIEVYYLISFWLVVSVGLMYLFTLTPMGRMANAVRDNPERAEFLGYSARWVRFYSFCAAGFFAGVAGGLFAINYELATADNLTVQASGTILMIAFLGGIGIFFGPILGAVVFTLLQTVLSLHTDLWQLYVGVLFLATVMFFPTGLAGVLMLHVSVMRRQGAGRLAVPYLKTVAPALVGVMGAIALVELVFHSRHIARGGEEMTLFWITFHTSSPAPWMLAVVLALVGVWGAKRNAPALIHVWQTVEQTAVR
ncbi:branched-chain amino acid ABC transporter permease [uncultured Sulfitobacter sp.]|uniref:branched-chain amino acid ABC transporter permease n=1 Tax=uncultured Sulfitobacter sp. TaxID=191468 RepID=UPI0026227DAF|nr:branched-chain amino acid ABC transporter permease [uncultured Sulfitobacter sp.]